MTVKDIIESSPQSRQSRNSVNLREAIVTTYLCRKQQRGLRNSRNQCSCSRQNLSPMKCMTDECEVNDV